MDINGKHILLVEDEALIGLAEKQKLEAYGYIIVLVHTGEAAVKLILDDIQFDLILMDINLGRGIDGTEAAAQILLHKDIPIVFLSSHMEKEIVERTEKITSYGYVVKNSGLVVLDASIKMAFKLFKSKTAEKEKEISLKKSEELLSLTQHLAKIGGWIQDVEKGTVEWTDELYAIHDFRKDEFETLEEKVQAGLTCFDDESRLIISDAYEKLVKYGIPYSLELPFSTRAGEKKWIWSVTQAVFENNKPKQLYGYFMDITDKVRIEEDNRLVHALLESEHNASIEGILVVDINGKVLSYNEKFCEIFDIPDDLIQTKDDNLMLEHSVNKMADPEGFLAKVRYLYDHHSESSRDEIKFKNGACFDRFSAPILDKDKSYLGRIWFFHDISALKSAEETAKRQVREKELLLKEVNHRIKNNITSVETLLQMQMSSINDGPAVEILQDAIGRVQSMRVIYDKLFINETFEKLSVKIYLGDLLEVLFSMFPIAESLEIHTEIEDFSMNIKDLFALGLIVNELVTNSMKYAFKKGAAGKLEVWVKRSLDTVLLAVHDSGDGITEAGDIKNRAAGFGLMLVSILTEQLGGSFTQSSLNGFISEVQFPLPGKV